MADRSSTDLVQSQFQSVFCVKLASANTMLLIPKFFDMLNAGQLIKQSSHQRQRTSLVWWSSDHCSCFSCDLQRSSDRRNTGMIVGELIPLGMAKRPPTAHSKNRRVSSNSRLFVWFDGRFWLFDSPPDPKKTNDYCIVWSVKSFVRLSKIICTVVVRFGLECYIAGDLPTQQSIMQELRTNQFHDPWVHWRYPSVITQTGCVLQVVWRLPSRAWLGWFLLNRCAAASCSSREFGAARFEPRGRKFRGVLVESDQRTLGVFREKVIPSFGISFLVWIYGNNRRNFSSECKLQWWE